MLPHIISTTPSHSWSIYLRVQMCERIHAECLRVLSFEALVLFRVC